MPRGSPNHKRPRVQVPESNTARSPDLGYDSGGSGASPSNRKKVRWEGNDSVAEKETGITESDDNDDELIPEKISLTAWCQHGRVGVAYYDPVKCTVYVLEDTPESQHFDLTQTILDQASPDVVLTSSKADDLFIDALREYVDRSGSVFQIRPYKDFNPSKGRDRLFSLQLLSELPSADTGDATSSGIGSDTSRARDAYEFMSRRRDQEGDPTMKRWNAAIRLCNFASVDSSPLCLASIGALLDHLVRDRALNDLEGEGTHGLDIREIEILALNEVMQINADALHSLQIFENESHACAQSDRTKEGLSLFGILDTTKTTLGRALLRTWLLRPSLSLSVIGSRHDAVECFMRVENVGSTSSLNGHLKGIKNVPRILGILKDGRGKISDWQGLVKFTFHCAMLKDALTELHATSHVDVIKKLFNVLDIACFRDVGNRINETVDWEESTQAGRVCVRPLIDEELDNRKLVYYGIDSVLSKVAQQMSQRVPADYAPSLNIVYFPQLGFLVCIPMLKEWQTEAGITLIDGWTSHVYFKSQEMHDMDAHIGDLHSLIVDREIEIIQSLLEEILVHYDLMTHACDICAELDCLLAFADASRLYGYRRPTMVDQNIIDIKQGRHPLQEQVVDTYVPNDAHLTGGFYDPSELLSDSTRSGDKTWNSVVLCTGANACGKSVFLKQIAMIQFMAQVYFVPAECATLGVVDKIFTRISTRESVSKVQSAFMIDLNQVSLALRNSTARSLVILDEFGKGTLSTDGAGLLCGVLKHLMDRGADCPKVLAATHFHDVFREELLDPDSTPITFLHMQVLFTSSTGTILEPRDSTPSANPEWDRSSIDRQVNYGEKITYLYRVVEGLSLVSHAAKCAEIFGLPSRVVERAQYVSEMISNHELSRLLDEEMTEEERKELEDAEAVCRRFLAWDLENEHGNVKKKLAEILGSTDED
ncbi:DNA mismatch repair protein MutS [Armillaria luteobubalina]|uniref:DNA mismatch repair protein MutS n=1 Tax=Armillaria luteobubalina TaxID=153913 RepID=A0AA39UUL3_9AGAR|nr:DNA mismatch repair protein MutS [Armillaria luteobubalina]